MPLSSLAKLMRPGAPDLPPDPDARRLGMIAGEGDLPIRVAKNAAAAGWQVFAYCLDGTTARHLSAYLPGNQIRRIRPLQSAENLRFLQADGIRSLVFCGKVNKWVILRDPRMDKMTWDMMRAQLTMNDDAVMLELIRQLDAAEIAVLPQTDFLSELFLPAGVYSGRAPSEDDRQDIDLGLRIAREMGRLDVGQSVIVSHRMVIAVEAIEGTDEAVKRSKKLLHNRGGFLVKVEKPGQDARFDIPTVGPRTLKRMREAGLHGLAIEAGKTLVLDPDEMRAAADRWKMVFVAV